MGRWHGGSREELVSVAGLAAEYADPRRGDIDRCKPVVGKTGEEVVAIRGRDGDDVLVVIAGRVDGADIVVVPIIVPGGRDKKDPRIFSRFDSRPKARSVTPSAPAVAQDMSAMVAGVLNEFNRV